MPNTTRDPEIVEFEAALLRSADDAVKGKFARVHTPAEIKARAPGRPVGSLAATRKTATTIRLDAEIVDAFKAQGRGWQSKINDALKDWLKTHNV